MPSQTRDLFVTLEGGDGSGKSTLAAALAERLRAEGYAVCRTQEPSGTPLGREIKSIFEQQLKRDTAPTMPIAELLLFMAARAQHVAEVIRPALEAGQIVLCDRFTDSSLAYQGYGRGLGLDQIGACNDIATGGLKPDVTLLLDVAPEIGLARADCPPMDRPAHLKIKDAIGEESLAFHQRVRGGFLALAGSKPERFVVIDAMLPEGEVTDAAWRAIQGALRP